MCLLMGHLTYDKLVFGFMYSLYQILNAKCIYRKAISYRQASTIILRFNSMGNG